MAQSKIPELLNNQINKELYSAYYYLSMASYLESKNLGGFANWFMIQTQEERDHALMFYNYAHKIGIDVKFEAIDAPPADFSSPMDILEKTLKHEKLVTSLIYAIMDEAHASHDYKTIQFLQWFVSEQAEEEETAANLVEKLKIAGTEQAGLFLMDQEMAARVYTPNSQLAAK